MATSTIVLLDQVVSRHIFSGPVVLTNVASPHSLPDDVVVGPYLAVTFAHGTLGPYDELIALGLALVIVLVAMLLGRGKPKD